MSPCFRKFWNILPIVLIIIIVFLLRNWKSPGEVKTSRIIETISGGSETSGKRRDYAGNKNKNPVIQVYQKRQPDHDAYLVANLTTKKGKLPICLFHVEEDAYISTGILETGRWEEETFDAVETLFEQNPDLDFLDIGSHVGNFALMAAKWGRHVLAVDSSFETICRLRRSCDLNHFSDKIVTIWNAVGDDYKTVTTIKYPRNFAAGYVVDIDGDNVNKNDIQEPVPMIHLDDLLEVTSFKTAIMKLDIEGYEGRAIKYADELFRKIDIPYVFMKWHILKKNEESMIEVLDFFTRHGYEASNIADLKPLTTPCKEWPQTYVWIKKTEKRS